MLATAVVSALAFNGPARAPGRSGVQMAMSKSIPFVKAPPALDGSMIGDVGFDPLGISTTIVELGGDLNYAREAEITHGRIAMLAAAGFLVPELFKFREYSARALEAATEVPVEVHGQIAVFVLIVEGLRSQIIYKDGAIPGDHGFDPLGFKEKFCKTPAAMECAPAPLPAHTTHAGGRCLHASRVVECC